MSVLNYTMATHKLIKVGAKARVYLKPDIPGTYPGCELTLGKEFNDPIKVRILGKQSKVLFGSHGYVNPTIVQMVPAPRIREKQTQSHDTSF